MSNLEHFGPSGDHVPVQTPVGKPCDYFRCGELICAGESGYIMPFTRADGTVGLYRIHRDCYLFSLGLIGVDHKAKVPHEPNSPQCDCDQWKHKTGF